MAAPLLLFDDFELDRSAYELRRSGRVVRLERIPLDLLFLLTERQGELVSRDEILERVWGKGVFLDVDNAINAAVRKVRRALNDSVDAPRFIVTVPAKGYRFLARVQEATEDGPGEPIVEAVPVVATEQPVIAAAPIARAEQQEPLRQRKIWGWIAASALAAAVIVIVYHPFSRRLADSAVVAPHKMTVPAQSAAARYPETAPALPSFPSIAVLPFVNLSGDPQREYFSDGISDQLITDLGRLPNLFVIARTSSFTYKNKPAKTQDIGRELGVKYLLEGSVLNAGNRVRIETHLVEARSGTDLWTERFDRPLVEIFSLQDNIVEKIVRTLNLQFPLYQRGIIINQSTENLEAYDDFLRGFAYFCTFSKDGHAKAKQYFLNAVRADPKYAEAYMLLGNIYWIEWVFLWHSDAHTLEQAFKYVRIALALNDSLPFAHALYGRLLVCKHQNAMAISEARRAIALSPNGEGEGAPYFPAAETLSIVGKPAEAIELSHKAMRLDPIHQDVYQMQIGLAYLIMKRYQDAVPPLQKFLVFNPNHVGGRMLLVSAYACSHRTREARSEAAELIRQSPGFPLTKLPTDGCPLWDADILALHQAGLK
jgi:adenylate cyclase